MTQGSDANLRPSNLYPLGALVVSVSALVWVYWPTLAEMAERWGHDPQYSHGYLVPVFALVLLWLRRQKRRGGLSPSWWGLPVLLAGLTLRLVGTYYHFIWLDAISLLPSLAGLCLMVGGWQALRWSWPAQAFLVFMIPLPYRLSGALADPLQRFATVASTLAMQTLGLPALAEGKVILLNEVEIGVVEACSGLRMLVIFFALSTAVALVMRRPLWEKSLLVASAIPIALLANVTRITVTGILHELVGSDIATAFFHDLAGWLMMPLALALLGLELKLLACLLLEPAAAVPARLELEHRRFQPPTALTRGPRESRRERRPKPRIATKPVGEA
jgi:exosortase